MALHVSQNPESSLWLNTFQGRLIITAGMGVKHVGMWIEDKV
jgi:hypothetical protein